jgi:hypothetical protein
MIKASKYGPTYRNMVLEMSSEGEMIAVIELLKAIQGIMYPKSFYKKSEGQLSP